MWEEHRPKILRLGCTVETLNTYQYLGSLQTTGGGSKAQVILLTAQVIDYLGNGQSGLRTLEVIK